jgi:uncharacterized membrane protein
MEAFGIGPGYLIIQILGWAILLAWIILGLYALRELKARSLPPTAKAIWALIIVFIAVLGAAAFLIVNPKERAV